MARAQTASLLEAQSQSDSRAQAAAQCHAELEGHSRAMSAQLQDFQQQVSFTLLFMTIEVCTGCLLPVYQRQLFMYQCLVTHDHGHMSLQ